VFRKTHWHRYACIIALLSAASLPLQAEQKPSFRSYLTGEGSHNRPRGAALKDFECSDTIYIVVEVTDPVRQKPSEHLLIVDWFNPGSKLQEKTRIEFKSYGKGTRIWAWLRLSGTTGASIGQMFDPSFGMGQFIGKWRAEVHIDDDKLDTHHFDVLC
jgi:hypothetical protein